MTDIYNAMSGTIENMERKYSNPFYELFTNGIQNAETDLEKSQLMTKFAETMMSSTV